MELLVCRTCLAVDVKLFVIEKQLFTAYQNILGKEITLNRIQYVCSLCATLFIKFMEFREQCVAAEKLLQGVMENVISNKNIENIQESLKKSYDLAKTEIHNINFVPEDTDLIEMIDNDNDDNDLNTVIKSDDDDEDDKKLIEFTNHNYFNPNHFLSDKNVNEIATNIVIVKNEIDTELKTKSHRKKANKQIKRLKTRESKRKNKIKIDEKKRSDNSGGKEYFEETYDVDIVELSKNEQIDEFSLRKTSKSYLQANYKCDLCYKGFLNEVVYRNHLNVFHDQSTCKFCCDVCNIRYRCSKSLKRHESMHKLKFACRKCDFVSRCSDQARRHYKYHAGHKYTCKYCDRSFGISTTYLSHVRLVHPAKLPSCSVCGEAFIGDVGLYQHMKRAHPEVVQYKCRLCKFEFQTNEALSMHISKRVNKKCATDLSSCKHCGENFENNDLLKKHFDDAHKKHIETYPCEQCKINFANTRSLEKHHQIVHLMVEPKRRQVSHSKNVTKDAENVKRKQSFSELCEVCGKLCTQYSTLRYHETLHAGVKPFKCEICQKNYLTANLLKIHSRIHSGNKSYKCDVCRKGFYNWSNLKRHELIHTGERPYPCDICGKCFQQSSNMKLHVQSVHLKVPQKPRVRKRRKDNVQPSTT